MQAKEVVFVFLITHIIKEVHLLCSQGVISLMFLLIIHLPVISIKYQIQVGGNLNVSQHFSNGSAHKRNAY